MINYGSKKRFYTDGQQFTLPDGSNYVGYVQVLSGVPYKDGTQTPLTANLKYESNLFVSSYFKNREILEEVVLPYKENDITFGSNDFLTYSLFLEKIGRLHDNNTYVYSRLFMPDNDLPNAQNFNYAYLKDINSTTLSLTSKNAYVPSVPFNASTNSQIKPLGDATRFTARLNKDIENTYSIFAITSSSFLTLTGNTTSCRIVEVKSEYIEERNNTLTFGELYDITPSRDFIFITDKKNSVIYKYEVGGYFNGDLALANKRNLIEILGGKGQKSSFSRLNAPTLIASNEDIIAVYDSGNDMIKIFDIYFNYITRISYLPLDREPVAGLKINEFLNILYVLTYSTTPGYLNLYIIDLDCYRLQESYSNIEVTLSPGETVKNIEVSHNNSDFYYICTNNQVYKLYTSKPYAVVGRYQETKLDYYAGAFTKIVPPGSIIGYEYTLSSVYTPPNAWIDAAGVSFANANYTWGLNQFSVFKEVLRPIVATTQTASYTIPTFNDQYRGITVMSNQNNYDSIIFLTNGRIYFYNEPNNYKGVIKFTDLDKFGRVNMTLSDKEYIQASTINKELYKVVRDIILMKNNIIGRFNGSFDPFNRYVLTDYDYNVDFNSFNLAETEDYYVHENEKSMVEVLNRSFKNVLELQKKLIELTKPEPKESIKRLNFLREAGAGIVFID